MIHNMIPYNRTMSVIFKCRSYVESSAVLSPSDVSMEPGEMYEVSLSLGLSGKGESPCLLA